MKIVKKGENMINEESNRGGVHIGGKLILGKESGLFSQDKVTIGNEGPKGAYDLSKAPQVLRLSGRFGSSIEQNGLVYEFKRQEGNEYIYERKADSVTPPKAESPQETAKPKVGSPEWQAQLQAKVSRATNETQQGLPSFEQVKNKFPPGSITNRDFVGGTLRPGDGKQYRMAQPMTQTTEGYVYVPVQG